MTYALAVPWPTRVLVLLMAGRQMMPQSRKQIQAVKDDLEVCCASA